MLWRVNVFPIRNFSTSFLVLFALDSWLMQIIHQITAKKITFFDRYFPEIFKSLFGRVKPDIGFEENFDGEVSHSPCIIKWGN